MVGRVAHLVRPLTAGVEVGDTNLGEVGSRNSARNIRVPPSHRFANEMGHPVLLPLRLFCRPAGAWPVGISQPRGLRPWLVRLKVYSIRRVEVPSRHALSGL